ncbi:MAG: glycosyltransferase N-terminal domain-containing protein [Bacteroidia bacterium]|nr:hypothetical protein [Bacteroidia bacterium]MDW8134058.1 glycosyltransferase N-terminal domain-containing protein [Bacteroidia bacterium]
MLWWRPPYTLFLLIGITLMPVIGLFSRRVRSWWKGRLKHPPSPPSEVPVLWLHCASAGEFEQGRPVIEYILSKAKRRPYVIVTFFSPSGWQRYSQSYPLADWIGPAPIDLPWIVRRWLRAIHPTAVFFVKYDLWPNTLWAISKMKCPTYLLAAHVEPLQGIRWWWRKTLLRFIDHIFVQTPADQLRLSMAGFAKVTVAGDSRLTRVLQIAENWLPVSGIAEWIGGRFCIVAGSVWEADIRFLAQAYAQLRGYQICWILVPHEVSNRQVEAIQRLWPAKSMLYTRSSYEPTQDTLIIDTLGILAYLYFYCSVAWIGGGFGSGIHNILEAVVYKKPVFFGPKYDDFSEARELMELGIAESCRYPMSFSNAIRSLIKDRRRLSIIAEKIERYLNSRPDTPKIIWQKLEEASWTKTLF